MSSPESEEAALFAAVLDRPAGERAAFLDGACRGDAALRARLEALLAANAAVDALPEPAEPPPGDPTMTRPVDLADQPDATVGQTIGRYRILEKVGEGGCGLVYVAEQTEPVRRRVALKVIKLGMDTKAVVARFEAERQALALMDHPNIARVLDAGATDTGRPYFIMELVRGIRITDYCEQAQLPARERLDLFVKVCHAIQHAHQKGIIHRDIKPSNILVTLHDGVPVPKVIDFGIAKATEGRLSDATVYTQLHQFIGTPAYMSPEQAEMSGLDIDTRSDIYSLGVLLYELLTGRTPFDGRELMSQGIDAMRKTIREKEPPRPSTKLSQTFQAARVRSLHAAAGGKPATEEEVGADSRRMLRIKETITLLKGDLDWIVMKCLEKDRTRRYGTANGLAVDLRRHLDNEPVAARPPSAAYRLQKAIRRNKLVFTAAVAIVITLVFGMAGSTWQAVRATRAERLAQSAQQEERRHRQEAEAARAQAETARQNEVRARQDSEIQELTARQRAYGSDMNLVQQALARNNLGRAQELLNRHRPEAGRPDLRGWEWRYLWQHCRSDAVGALGGARNTIGSLAVSHDAKWLAMGENANGMLSIWDLASRELVTRFKAGDGDVRLAWGNRTRLLAYWCGSDLPSGGPPSPVWLWDGTASRVITNCWLAGPCQGLAFSDDDQRLVSCASAPENEIAVWQVATGKKLMSCPAEHPGGRASTSFAATRDLAVVAHEAPGGRIRIVALNGNKELWATNASEELITAIAISPDGSMLASGAGWVDSAIRVWETRTGREIKRFQGHNAFVSQLVFSADGTTLVSASGDQTIRFWDVANLRPAGVLRGHSIEVWRLALSPDQKTLVSGGKDGTVYIWDPTRSRRDFSRVTLPAAVAAWWFGPEGGSVLTLDRQGRVARWSGESFEHREALFEIGRADVGWRTAISQHGRWLAVGLPNGAVQTWDLERRTLRREFSNHAGLVFPVAFLARESRLVVLHVDDHSFHELDLATGAETRSWAGPDGLSVYSPATFSTDEQWCLMAKGRVLRNMATGAEQALPAEMRDTENATFSPDGRRVAIASYLGFAQMWGTRDWNPSPMLHGFLVGVHSVAFSPDSRRLATGSSGQEALKIWDTEGLQEVLTLEGNGGIFLRTAFSPDGNILGSMNKLGTLHLWRAPSWEEIDAADATAKPRGKQP